MSEENLSSDKEYENLKEEKERISLEKPNPGIYKEGMPQSQGEYHQNSAGQDSAYQQRAVNMQNEAYPQGYWTPQQPQNSQGFGIASLVLGILSLLIFCSCVNIPMAIMAIIFGIVQLTKTGSKKGMAIAGIITSILSFIVWAVFIMALVFSAEFQEGFERGLRNGINEDYYEYNFPDFGERHHDDTF